MNADRRARLRIIRNKLNDVRDDLESVREDEDEARDNMPENLAYSDRYERSEECSSSMDDAIGYISDAINSVEEAI